MIRVLQNAVRSAALRTTAFIICMILLRHARLDPVFLSRCKSPPHPLISARKMCTHDILTARRAFLFVAPGAPHHCAPEVLPGGSGVTKRSPLRGFAHTTAFIICMILLRHARLDPVFLSRCKSPPHPLISARKMRTRDILTARRAFLFVAPGAPHHYAPEGLPDDLGVTKRSPLRGFAHTTAFIICMILLRHAPLDTVFPSRCKSLPPFLHLRQENVHARYTHGPEGLPVCSTRRTASLCPGGATCTSMHTVRNHDVVAFPANKRCYANKF
jgi:hypothetical protein